MPLGTASRPPHQDSAITIRSLMPAGAEHDPGAWRYAFGNGSARGVAAMTVWVLFDQLLSTSPAPGEPLQAWLLNFFKIPSIYEHYGDGSTRATLVHTIARQEQDAMVEGVSTVDWITIILSQGGSGLSFAGITRKKSGSFIAGAIGPLRGTARGAGLRRSGHAATQEAS